MSYILAVRLNWRRWVKGQWCIISPISIIIIYSSNMAGEKTMSQCFLKQKKNGEGSIRTPHLTPRWGMWEKERTSAKKILGKVIQVSKNQNSNKALRLFGLLCSSQTWHGWQRRGKEKKPDEVSSDSEGKDAVAWTSRRARRGDRQRIDWNEA